MCHWFNFHRACGALGTRRRFKYSLPESAIVTIAAPIMITTLTPGLPAYVLQSLAACTTAFSSSGVAQTHSRPPSEFGLVLSLMFLAGNAF